MYKLLLGIEHFMTGVQLVQKDNGERKHVDQFQFERESASVIAVLCDEPFCAAWPVKGTYMEAWELEGRTCTARTKTSTGEAEWYAQVLGENMRQAEAKSFRMKGYKTPPDQTRDWPDFTPAVIASMRRKFGKDADDRLANLTWYGSYWGFHDGNCFIGVEIDGYMHS